ncbi:GtrA family protein [soil metagenome]
MRLLVTQLARFGVVGLIGLVIDVGVFNILRATLLEPSVIHEGPFVAKVISTCLAIAANYYGNRYWTFSATRRAQVAREGTEFLLVSLGGMAITLACLWISHYLLGFTSVLADNIAGNVVGLALGTAFRFAFYRSWVFHPRRSMPLRPAETAVVPAGGPPGDRVEAVAAVDDHAVADD